MLSDISEKSGSLDSSLLLRSKQMRLYNSLTHQLEEFIPIRRGEVGYYSCGPTIYNYAHIGNCRSFVFSDFLKRTLRFKGFAVRHVMNITDVDDKTIRDSRAEGKSLSEFTDFYLAGFLEDLRSLNILPPDVMPRATDEIESMVDMIETLIEKNAAYKTDRGDVYFRISAFPRYGKLVNLDQSKLRENAAGRLQRSDEYEKDDARDFALWKAWDEGDGDVFWETRIGRGRPGWHIECSAMSIRYLGETFDIHSGGIDLAFPHHTNEIAQSECATGKTFARYWLHHEHLLVNGQKMSKSAGNFFTLRDLTTKGHHPLAIRLELLKTHYRQRSDFREENIASNLRFIERLRSLREQLQEREASTMANNHPTWRKELTSFRKAFEAALDDDLNISVALSAVHEFVSASNKTLESLSGEDTRRTLELLDEFDGVLGVIPSENISTTLDPALQALFDERVEARAAKNFKRSDELRDELLKHGIEIKDTPQGTTWKKLLSG